MIRLSSIIKTFGAGFLEKYRGKILPSHRKALGAMENCRSKQSPKMLVGCTECDQQIYVPHSCGHRNCPHCQNHESQQWLERQLKKQVPAEYFLVTFTLPAEFRSMAWLHQRIIYSLMIQCCWDTLKTFSQNDKELQGIPGGHRSVAYSFTRPGLSSSCPHRDASRGNRPARAALAYQKHPNHQQGQAYQTLPVQSQSPGQGFSGQNAGCHQEGGAGLPCKIPGEMDSELQVSGVWGEGIGLSGTLSVPWSDSGKGHCHL